MNSVPQGISGYLGTSNLVVRSLKKTKSGSGKGEELLSPASMRFGNSRIVAVVTKQVLRR